MFFAQTAFMLLGGSALVAPEGARSLYAGLLTVYELVYLVRLGQTPGKDLLHVKVVTTGGGGLSIARGLLRWLPLLVVVAAPDVRVGAGLVVVTAVLAIAHPQRRAGHDLLAGTRVISWDADEEEGVDPVDLGPLDELRRNRRFR